MSNLPARFRFPSAGLLTALACGALTLAAGMPAWSADTRIIGFDEALRIALEQNNLLRQAQNSAELSDVAVSEARSDFLPDLRFNTSTAQNYGRNFSETEGSIIDRSSRSLNAGVSSGVTVFDGFRNTANLKGAKLSRQASRFDLTRTRETVVFTVASNFLSLIQQREQLRVQRDNLTAESALEEQIKTYVSAGARTVADLYQQQAAVASARLTLTEQERAAELAKVDLIQTLQLDPHGTYEFEAPPAESISVSPKGSATASQPAAGKSAAEEQTIGAANVDLDKLLTRALGQRADIAAERARVEASEQSIRAAHGGRWPTVSLSAGYNTGYTSISPLDFSDQLDLRRGGSIGLQMSVPIFDRNSTRNAIRRAELQALDARITLENAVQDVGLQVRRAHLDYRAAQQQLTAAEAQQRAAELALKAAQDRYQAGASTLVELSQARARSTEAASALVTARYNLLFQKALVDYYLGDLQLDASR